MNYGKLVLLILIGIPAVAIAQDYSYCIVVHDSLVDEIQPLADWKDTKGCTTFVATIGWIEQNYPGRDRAEKIRNFVAHSDSIWPSFEYLLLAGDTATVPPRYVIPDFIPGLNCTIPSDDYYTNLATNWDLDNDSIFGEDSTHCSQGIDEIDFYDYRLYVGRLPSDNPTEIINMVDKIINYEQSPPPGDWPERMIFCAAVFNVQDSSDCIAAKESVYNNHFPHPNNFQIARLYESMRLDFDSLTVDNFLSYFNQGTSIVNSISHGSPQYFHWYQKIGNTWILSDYITSTHAASVTNGYKLPMIVACACATAWYDDPQKCLGEAFMTASNGGCIVFIGSTRYDLGQEYYFYYNFFGSAQQRAGVAWRMAKYDQLIYWGPGQDEYWRFHYLSPIMFGDPELKIRTEPVGIEEIAELNHQGSYLENHPNPFRQTTRIKFQTLQSVHVSIKIYDITGHLVRTLLNEHKPTGIYDIIWEGMDTKGKKLPGGVYFIKFEAGNYKETRKIILLR